MSAQYFIRFVASPEQARFDLERGHSFHGYNLRHSVEDLLDADGLLIDEETGEVTDYDGEMKYRSIEDAMDALDIRQDNATGLWGYAADGLAGFGSYDSVEEALADELNCHYGGGEFVSVWLGESVADYRIFDGTSFNPKRLILVQPRANRN